MLRLVVAIYLMIVAAANPATCCCTLTRLTTRLVPITSPVVPKAPTCCHCTESEALAETSDQQKPSDRPGCPCKQGGGCEVIALPASLHESLDSSRASAEPFDIFLALPLDQGISLVHASSVFREGSAHGLSADDLLCGHHRLRC